MCVRTFLRDDGSPIDVILIRVNKAQYSKTLRRNKVIGRQQTLLLPTKRGFLVRFVQYS